MLRPYRRWTATPWMFMVASVEPSNRPVIPTATYSHGRVGANPTAVIATATSGPEMRSTTLLPKRDVRLPASTLPTPATTGTTSRMSVSALSERPNFDWSVGVWVSRPAKHMPWTK